MRVITQSEIRAFKSCRLKHHLQYNELLASKKPPGYLRFGTAIHAGLEAFHKGEDYSLAECAFGDSYTEAVMKLEANPDVELWEEDRQEIEQEKQLGWAMLKRYVDFNASQEPLKVVSLEQKFTVNLRTPSGHKSPVKLSGKIDGIIKDIHGNLFLLEHKTAASIDNKYIAKLDLDDQVNTYLWAALELGYDVKGVFYNVLAKWIPQPPEILKSGKRAGRLSANKTMKTTHALYQGELDRWGLEPDEEERQMLSMLEAKGDQTFLREKVYRNRSEINRIGQELYLTARDMAKPHIYRNPAICERSGCTVRSLCIEDGPEARLNFRIKTSKHEELEDENGNDT